VAVVERLEVEVRPVALPAATAVLALRQPFAGLPSILVAVAVAVTAAAAALAVLVAVAVLRRGLLRVLERQTQAAAEQVVLLLAALSAAMAVPVSW